MAFPRVGAGAGSDNLPVFRPERSRVARWQMEELPSLKKEGKLQVAVLE